MAVLIGLLENRKTPLLDPGDVPVSHKPFNTIPSASKLSRIRTSGGQPCMSEQKLNCATAVGNASANAAKTTRLINEARKALFSHLTHQV